MESVSGEQKVSEAYRRWARVEADERSPRYAEWARGVAADEALCAALAELEPIKRQPNLLFAAARFEGVPLQPWTDVRDMIAGSWNRIRSTMLARMTQTNEARRMATQLPAIAHLRGPVALVDVGASAGLCLYPDRWRYRFGAGRYVGDASLPLLETVASPSTLPDASGHTSASSHALVSGSSGSSGCRSRPPRHATLGSRSGSGVDGEATVSSSGRLASPTYLPAPKR